MGHQILIIVQEAAPTPREKWGYHNPSALRRGARISEGVATLVLGPLEGKGTPTTRLVLSPLIGVSHTGVHTK